MLAFLIDHLGVLLPLWVGYLVVVAPRYGDGWGAIAIFTALELSYHFVCEATTGQSIGKRVAGLRVVSLDGGLPGLGQAATRTVLRLVDQGIILLGILVMVGTGKRRQRVGDLLAGTAVALAARHPVDPRSLTPRVLGYPFAWVAPATGGRPDLRGLRAHAWAPRAPGAAGELA